MTLYFAFGSNLSTAQMKDRCPAHKAVSPARLKGYRLDFTCWAERRSGGVADVVQSSGHEVWGALYDVNEADLAALDGFEGVSEQIYRRTTIEVEDNAGQTHLAEVYEVVRKEGPYEPSRSYMGVILQGAGEWELPKAYIEQLESIATCD